MAYPVCVQVFDAWTSVRKGLVDRGYRGELIENITRGLNIDIEVCYKQTELAALHQSLCDGHPPDLVASVGLHEPTKSPMPPLRK